MKTLTLEVRGLFEELDHLAVERHVSALDGVHRAESNPASASVTVQYDPAVVDEAALRAAIRSCGFHCAGERLPNHVCHTLTADKPAHAGHSGHAAEDAKPAAGHDAMAHEMGHGGGMYMSDMVRDMRNRFWFALLFSVPIFIYSPMGGLFTPPHRPSG